MQIEFIMPGEVEKWRRRGAVFVDLREVEEYREYHIKGAVSMPYEEFENHMHRLSRNREYVLYCDRGATSMLAARKMMSAGYRVRSLSGGMEALRRQNA